MSEALTDTVEHFGNIADRLDEMASDLLDLTTSANPDLRTIAHTLGVGSAVLRELSARTVTLYAENLALRRERNELSETIGRLRRTIEILDPDGGA